MASWLTHDVPYAYETQKKKRWWLHIPNTVSLILVFHLPVSLGKFPFLEVFGNTILVLTSLMFASILLFTSEINITLYPAHILDPTCVFHQRVCVW